MILELGTRQITRRKATTSGCMIRAAWTESVRLGFELTQANAEDFFSRILIFMMGAKITPEFIEMVSNATMKPCHRCSIKSIRATCPVRL